MEASQSQKTLDAEFRKILRIIKPYIPCINNNTYITHYRLWLEKLSEVGPHEKQERNVYLQELLKQIEKASLDVPFSEVPQRGPLIPFWELYWKCKSKDNQHQENAPDSIIPSPVSPGCTPKSSNFLSGYTSQEYLDLPSESNPNNLYFHTRYSDIHQTYPMYYALNFKQSTSASPLSKSTIVDEHKLKPKITRLGTKRKKHLVKMDEIERDNSSWCDLTDASTTVSVNLMGSGDSEQTNNPNWDNEMRVMYEAKMRKMVEIIKKLEEENQKLNNKVESAKKDLEIRNAKTNQSIHNLSGEVDTLRTRLQELLHIKAALQDSSFTSSTDVESTLEILENELKKTQDKNNQLKESIVMLQTQLKEAEATKQKEQSSLKKRLVQLYTKEIEMIKELHEQEIEKLENTHKQKIIEKDHLYNIKIEELKNHYESKLLDMSKKFDDEITQKDTQIKQLEQAVHEQCTKMEKEVKFIRSHLKYNRNGKEDYVAKIDCLEKFILRMENLFKKTEKEHGKQIAKLRKDIELREKTNQLLMSSQRVQMVANNTKEAQQEMETIVNDLENRYKGLLEKVLEQSILSKKHDAQIIEQLQERLAEHEFHKEQLSKQAILNK